MTIRQHRYTLAELEAAQREAIAITNQLAIPTPGPYWLLAPISRE